MGELDAVSQSVDFISLGRITLMDIVVSRGSSRGREIGGISSAVSVPQLCDILEEQDNGLFRV